MALAENIKALRKKKGMTQEELAEDLHISAQAVSKWETGQSCPDVEMLPKLAIIFDTSLDKLFDFDHRKIEEEVDALVKESVPMRKEPAKAEAFYREALRKYPGNEVLLNCLLMVIDEERADERIRIAEQVIEETKEDAIKYDALRLLTQTYHTLGQHAMSEHYLAQIPELYFLKTEIAAIVLDGKEQQDAISKTEKTCFGILLAILLISKAKPSAGHSGQDADDLEQLLIQAYARLFGEDAAERIHKQYKDRSLMDFYL